MWSIGWLGKKYDDLFFFKTQIYGVRVEKTGGKGKFSLGTWGKTSF